MNKQKLPFDDVIVLRREFRDALNEFVEEEIRMSRKDLQVITSTDEYKNAQKNKGEVCRLTLTYVRELEIPVKDDMTDEPVKTVKSKTK